MTNLESLNGIFCEVFSVKATVLDEKFDKYSVEGWDSVRQLSLVSAVEDKFDIMIDAEEILEFISYVNVKRVLTKYGVEL